MKDKTITATGSGNIGVGTSSPSSDISFSITEEGKQKEIIRISKGKFYWKGKEIDDVHKVYERFNKWLGLAEKTRWTT